MNRWWKANSTGLAAQTSGGLAAEAEESADCLRRRQHEDSDELIEAMTQRLREQLRSLEAYDEWGRPLAWHEVVRIATGPTVARLRDAEAARDLALEVILSPLIAHVGPEQPNDRDV